MILHKVKMNSLFIRMSSQKRFSIQNEQQQSQLTILRFIVRWILCERKANEFNPIRASNDKCVAYVFFSMLSYWKVENIRLSPYHRSAKGGSREFNLFMKMKDIKNLRFVSSFNRIHFSICITIFGWFYLTFFFCFCTIFSCFIFRSSFRSRGNTCAMLLCEWINLSSFAGSSQIRLLCILRVNACHLIVSLPQFNGRCIDANIVKQIPLRWQFRFRLPLSLMVKSFFFFSLKEKNISR